MGMLSALARRLGYAPSTEVTSARERALAAENMAIRRHAQASGVAITMGRYDYELNQRLRGSQRWDALETMQTDPHVKGSLRFNTLPLLAAPWDVVPASDKPRDVEIAEFVSANYLNKPSDRFGREYWCASSWRQRLFEKLDMLASGFAMSAYTMRRQGSRVVYDRVQWLEPSSVDPHGWELDDEDNIVQVLRTYQTPTNRAKFREPLEVDQINLDVWELKGARYEGCPFLRSMWGAYYRKDQYVRYALAWAQKVGAGSPVGWYPPGLNNDQIQKFIEFVEQQRGQAPAESFGVFPMSSDGKPGEVKYTASDAGEVDRMRGLIRGENDEMAQSGGNTAMQATDKPQGSRAMVQTISEVEIMFLGAISSAVCEGANTGVANLEGEIPRLVRLNFGMADPPMLVCQRVHPSQGLEHAPGIIAGVAAGLIPNVPELRKQFSELYGLKLPEDAYEVEPVQPMAPGQKPADDEPDDAPEDDEPDEEDTESKAEEATSIRAKIAHLMDPDMPGPPAAKMHRRPNKLETRYLSLASMQQSYEQGEQRSLAELRKARQAMVRDLVRRVETGKITPRNLEPQSRSKARGVDRMAEELLAVLRSAANEGRTEVKKELSRMERG